MDNKDKKNRKEMKACPICGEDVEVDAIRCERCGSDLGSDDSETPKNENEDSASSSASTRIAELKEAIETKTTTLVLLTIATAGLFPILWLYRHQATINRITKSKIATDVYVIWIAVCSGMSDYLYGIDPDGVEGDLAGWLFLGTGVLFIVWAFKARKALCEYALQEFKVDLRMNAFYTLIFTVFYVNYCINDLPEAKRKADLLKGGNS